MSIDKAIILAAGMGKRISKTPETQNTPKPLLPIHESGLTFIDWHLRALTAAGAKEAAEANPAAHLVEIPDAGHMVFWDNPPAALPLLRTALADLLG